MWQNPDALSETLLLFIFTASEKHKKSVSR